MKIRDFIQLLQKASQDAEVMYIDADDGMQFVDTLAVHDGDGLADEKKVAHLMMGPPAEWWAQSIGMEVEVITSAEEPTKGEMLDSETLLRLCTVGEILKERNYDNKPWHSHDEQIKAEVYELYGGWSWGSYMGGMIVSFNILQGRLPTAAEERSIREWLYPKLEKLELVCFRTGLDHVKEQPTYADKKNST